MSTSTVVACMAPLLLRPLLAGECEIETDFNVGGDSSIWLLQAAATANHAQITLQLFGKKSKIKHHLKAKVTSDLAHVSF
ncbi:hypothetical protein WN943_005130 [Citrus x changshan-huyou]